MAYPAVPTVAETDVDENGRAVVGVQRGSIVVWEAQQAGAGVESYKETFGDGSATNFTITHNLGSRDLLVSLRRLSDNFAVDTHYDFPSDNTINVDFSVAPAVSDIRIVVVKA